MVYPRERYGSCRFYDAVVDDDPGAPGAPGAPRRGHAHVEAELPARGRAGAGKRYDEILAVYYPGAPLMRIY